VLAFGDSITFGADSLCNGLTALRWTPGEWLRSWEGMAQVAAPYPSVLERMLKERYTAQSPTVFNAGVSGETVTDPATRQRFTRALNERNPEIVLLQEGINDLHAGTTRIAPALRAMSLEARGRGIQVFLGTLLPERPNGCRAFAVPPRNEADFIRPANDDIRSMAATEKIDLVDLYAVFESHLSEYIGQDGLHPTEIGYSAIAQAFYDAIRTKFEHPVASTRR
jgi:lysophospholipase L1-like esterase